MRFTLAVAAVVIVHAAPRAARAQQAQGDSVVLEISVTARGIRGVVGRDSIQRLPSDAFLLPRGARVTYALVADTGYNKLSVLLDGRRIAPSGTIAMDRGHLLSVTSERVPRLVPQNQVMYDILKQMLALPDPRPRSHALFDEIACVNNWYGEVRARQLHDDALQLLAPTQAAMEAYLRMESKLAGEEYSPRCAKPRPRDATRLPPKRPAPT
jgi:hypothetical protein